MNAPSSRFQAWDKKLYLILLGIYLVLAISALAQGVTSWDEETDYLGIRTQVLHAIEFIRGNSPDYRNIHSNLEYYGTAGLLPAWILWFFQQSSLVGRLSLGQALMNPAADHQLTGFFFNSHLILAIEFLAISFAAVKISTKLKIAFPWLSGVLCLLSPSLLGHSYVNPKDIPLALFYTAYTYSLLLRAGSSDKNNHGLNLALVVSGLLVNQKFVMIIPFVISEGVLILISRNRRASSINSIKVIFGAILLALFLQPASWGVSPIQYLSEAFNTFSKHEWGGCMWYANTCVGINHPDWNTQTYIWNWISIKLPLLWTVLLSLALIYCFRTIAAKGIGKTLNHQYLFIIMQISLVPLLSIVKQSNLYDADRHLLFIYPALAIICASGFSNSPVFLGSGTKMLLYPVIALLSLLLLLDNLSLNPYQSSYLNEFARNSHSYRTTSLDYWAISAKELIRNAQLNGALTTSPHLRGQSWISPFWIGFRQLDGIFYTDDVKSIPYPHYQFRDKPSFENTPDRCELASSVQRKLAFAPDLLMSRLYLCE